MPFKFQVEVIMSGLTEHLYKGLDLEYVCSRYLQVMVCFFVLSASNRAN